MSKVRSPLVLMSCNRRQLYVVMLMASHVLLGHQALAAPQGGEIVGGLGNITQDGANTFVRQETDRLAIDWQRFDVGVNERVEFIQPDSSSIVLNRVLSNRTSEILGRIDANGQVFLVNPNGIIFGKDSIVNVGGMIASGLSINPDSFINGDFTLGGLDNTGAAVINYGIINAATGGSVSLIGSSVNNQGVISANLGAVNLAAGKEAVLTFDSGGLVGVKVTQAVLQEELGVDAVVNGGEVHAQGGRVLLTASQSEDVFSNAVNHGGMNRAASVVMHGDGSFTLGNGADVINSGEIDVSVDQGNAGQVVVLGENITHTGKVLADTEHGQAGFVEFTSRDTTLLEGGAKVSAATTKAGSGGDIKLLGHKVGLTGTARVDASGAQGGGQVLVGGDETGANPRVRNADFIFLGENTNVLANGLLDGDGGRVIGFANDTARFYGGLSATGGVLGGNGGFVETSGLQGFVVETVPDIFSPTGSGGTWLIDPYDITISEGSTNTIDPIEENNKKTFESALGSNVVHTITLNTALQAVGNGGQVIIKTGAGGAEQGNITWEGDFEYYLSQNNHSATLRLEAANNIEIKNNITGTTGRLNVELIADSDNNGSGGISFNSGKYIHTRGGYFLAEGNGFSVTESAIAFLHTGRNPSEIFNEENSRNTAGGNAHINVTGDVTLQSALITDGGDITIGGIDAEGNVNNRVTSFSNNFNNATLNTYNRRGAGDIKIAANSDIDLGDINFRYLYSTADGTVANLMRVGSLLVDSKQDIFLSRELNFNDTGKRKGDGSKGYSGSALDNDNTTLVFRADESIYINAQIADVDWGDARDALDITLAAGRGDSGAGNVNIDNNIYTAGGNFYASGHSFIQTTNTVINTDRANHRNPIAGSGNPDRTDIENGNARWSNGGNVNIEISAQAVLGNIKTDGDCDNSNCVGDLKILRRNSSDNIDAVTQLENTELIIAGTTVVDIGSGSLTLDKNNKFVGSIFITSAGNVNLYNAVATSLGRTTIEGNFTLESGDLIDQLLSGNNELIVSGTTTINANAHKVALVNENNSFNGLVSVTNATNFRLKSNDSFAVGAVTIVDGDTGNIQLDVANGSIQLNGNLNTGAGDEGNITLNGNVFLGEDVVLNTGMTSDSDKRKITITGTLDSQDATTRDITLVGNEFSLLGDWGSIFGLGDVVLESTTSSGIAFKTTANEKVNIIANDFLVKSAKSFESGSISTSGSGGDVKITAGNISVGSINANNETGSAGTILLTANSSSASEKYININGDLLAESGAGAANIQLVLAKSVDSDNSDVAGAIYLKHSNFFSSDITITGNGDSDSLYGSNMENLWKINTNNSGTLTNTAESSAVISFSDMEYLIGGDSFDFFTFSDTAKISGLINGGGGNNTLDISGVTTNYAVAVGHSTTSAADITATGIKTFVGSGAYDHSLAYLADENADTSWHIYKFSDPGYPLIDGVNDGVIVDKNLNSTKFIDFSKIVGGSGKDTFYFDQDELGELIDISRAGSIGHLIDGGAGENKIVGRNTDTLWNITDENAGDVVALDASGTKYVESFANIQSLLGAGNRDTFRFDNGGKVTSANGGAGENTADLSLINSDVTITLGQSNDFSFTNVSTIIGNDAANFTLATSSGSNEWHIYDFDSADLVSDGENDGEVGGIKFVNFKTLLGGDGNDIFTIDTSFTGTINGGEGASTFYINAAVNSLVGGAGDDRFVLGTNGSVSNLTGGNGSDILVGKAGNSTWSITGINSGSVGITAGSTYITSFSQVENLEGGAGAVFFAISNAGSVNSIRGGEGSNTLRSANTANTWNITSTDQGSLGVTNGAMAVTNFSQIHTLQGGSGIDTFNLSADFTGAIKGGAGADIFTIDALVGSIFGEAGDDSFIFGTNGSVSSLAGGNGSDTLVGKAGNSTWSITGASSGSVGITEGSTYITGFSQIENLEGGAGVDHFVVSHTGSMNNINGGAGNNILTAANTANTWSITSADQGSLGVTNGATSIAHFSQIQTLQGGSGVDTFVLDAAFSGIIKGGTGADIFTINAAVNHLQGEDDNDRFVLGTNGSVNNLAGGNGSDTLVGKADNSTWSITGINSGSVDITEGSTYVTSFSQIENLEGSVGADYFVVSTTGSMNSIKGGAGSNILSAANTANTWSITSADQGSLGVINGATSITNFSQIQTLQGGSGIDTFVLDAAFSGIIKGGTGADIFTINAAVNNLQGDDDNDRFVLGTNGSVNSLAGGNGSDTLVGKAGNSTWSITGINSGSVGITAGSTYITSFSQIENLEGGAGADLFAISNPGSMNSIRGGGGSNTLRSANTANTWNVASTDQGSLGVTNGAMAVTNFSQIHTLQGGSGVDTFNLSADFTGAIKGGAGADIFTIDALVGSIFGEAGDDSFIFGTNGSVSSLAGGNGSDTLVGKAGNSTWSITGASSGSVGITEGSTYITGFSQIENLEGGAGVDHFVVSTTGSMNTIKGGAGNNSLTAANTANTWNITNADQGSLGITNGAMAVTNFSQIHTLQGGSGIDTFNVSADFTGAIKGGVGADVFTINAAVNNLQGDDDNDRFVLDTNGSVNSLAGGNGNDTLVGKANNSTWAITGANSGTVSLTEGAVYVANFSQIENLEGGAGADHFAISNTGSMNSIKGGAGSNILSAANTANTWSITSADQGSLGVINGATSITNFSQIQTLQGGSGIDTFVLDAAFSGIIKGGAGADIFTINADVNNLQGDDDNDRFVLGSNGSVNSLAGGNGSDTLVGKTGNSTWLINGINSGSAGISEGATYVTSFSQIENLEGGAGADHFVVSTTGTMNSVKGGAGNNSLTAANTANTWSITSADQGSLAVTNGATHIANFSQIQTLQGGSGVDTFNLSADFTGAIKGGAGADIFTIDALVGSIFGEAGDDRFVLGTNGSVNSLAGGNGSDTLVGKAGNSTWSITGINSGSVGISEGATYVTSFSQIENLEGGAGADHFIVSPTGTMNDINGGAGSNTLSAANTDNEWNITGINSGDLGRLNGAGYVATFAQIQHLKGNAAVDIFTFADNATISGVVDGGTSLTRNNIKDSIDFTALTGGVALDLGDSEAGAIKIRNIEEVTASTHNPNNNMIFGASDQEYVWAIKGVNSGSIAPVNNTALENTLKFYNFGDLRGGVNHDTFNISGSISKNISGGDGAGVDRIDYSNLSGDLSVVIGSAGGLGNMGVNGIEGIKGNYGNPHGGVSTINATSLNNSWVIGTDGTLGDGINDGSVSVNNKTIYFENFTNIAGGNGIDQFNYTANGQWLGVIDGGGGTNTLDATAAINNQKFNVVSTNNQHLVQAIPGTLLVGVENIKANHAVFNSLVSAETANTWVVNTLGNGVLNEKIQFSGFSSLIGGELQDHFIFSNINSLKGVIDGAGGEDVIDLTAMNKAVSVSNGHVVGVDLYIANIENLKANNTFQNRFYAAEQNNYWLIDGLDSGLLNTNLRFSGFSALYGGKLNDALVFGSNEAAISGYLNMGEGQDSVDTSLSSADQSFYIRTADTNVQNGLVLVNVESLIGNNTVKNTLAGDDLSAAWFIDDINAGDVTINKTARLYFSGINNLVGGSADDVFTFGINGVVSGVVDGGNQTTADVVDLSRSKTVNVVITDSDETGFRNIEKYNGNSISTRLTADNIRNQWEIFGTNTGVLNQTITFENMASLFGGNKVDAFSITNANITGKIDAGAGNDEFIVSSSQIAGGLWGGSGNDGFNIFTTSQDTGELKLYGGAGTNILSVTGSHSGMNVNHYSDRFEYVFSPTNTLSLQIAGMSEISDATFANTLNVFTSLGEQEIHLTTGMYQVADLSSVYFANKNNINIQAQATDRLIIEGDLTFKDSLAIHNASVESLNGVINTNTLQLVGTQHVGVNNALRTNVDNLILRGVKGTVNLNEQNDIALQEFNAVGKDAVSINAGGNITSSQAINFDGALTLNSRTAGIALVGSNRLGGLLNLSGQGDIKLENAGTTYLANVKAQNLKIESNGAVDGQGAVQVVGHLEVKSNAAINLVNINNNFGSVDAAGTSIALYDHDGFSTRGIFSSENLDIGSAGRIELGACVQECTSQIGVSGQNVKVHSLAGPIELNTNLFVASDVLLTGMGLLINNNVSANSISMDGLTSDINIGNSSILQATDKIQINANNVIQEGALMAGENIDVIAAGDITMSSGVISSSTHGNINYTGSSIALSLLQAADGIVATWASKNIKDNNGDDLNIQAKRWNVSAENGIGFSVLSGHSLKDAIETDIDELSAINGGVLSGGIQSSINIQEKNTILIRRLANNGDISFSNVTGDIVLDKRENGGFDPNQIDARLQGGVINSNKGVNGGTLMLATGNGSILAQFEDDSVDMADMENPDIIAENSFFSYTTRESLGQRNRKMVMSIRNVYENNAKVSFVRWYEGQPPLINNDASRTPPDLSLSEQLIQIEALSDIDPAVFTSVRNYVNDEIAILLPPDQRFDSEDDEDGFSYSAISR